MSQYFLDFVTWLNGTRLSTGIREGDNSFILIETVHLLGLAFSVGTIMWVDLRLLGLAMQDEPVSDVVEQLEPWAIWGFGVMFISGFFLLVAEPLKAYTTLSFRLKALMLVLAALNVLYFHKRVYHNVDQWDRQIPWRAKMVGIFSLALWFGIIIAGRWFAYF
jgi:hypothetical protein